MSITIVDPTFGLAIEQAEYTRGTFDLRTARVTMFSNSKPNAPELLEGVRQRLCDALGRNDIGFEAKDNASRPAPQELIDHIANSYDVAIVALGDCGSCSSYCLHDALALENKGLTCFVIITEVFEQLIKAQSAAVHASPNLIVIKHPVAGLTEDELRPRMDEVFEILSVDELLGAAS